MPPMKSELWSVTWSSRLSAAASDCWYVYSATGILITLAASMTLFWPLPISRPLERS